MCPYGNFKLFRTMATFCHFQFFEKYLLCMHTDKRQEIFNEISKNCLGNDKSNQCAKMAIVPS